MDNYMHLAILEAKDGIKNHHGGPFGTVIIKDGIVIAGNHNRVLKDNDPSAHGEITCIREACEKLDTFDLTGCTLYTTAEPCHMCLCACMWANIDKVYYGCTIKDTERIGFRDDKFDKIFGGRDKLQDYLININREECLELFEEYNSMSKTLY